MGEYEDRYPEAYGHGEVIEESRGERHFTGVELPRQTRDPALPVDRTQAGAPPGPRAPHPRIARNFVVRPAPEIRNDVVEQLNDNPYIDASGIVVTVEGSEVTLDGMINSLMAISLARALVSNIAGVSRVQVQLRVQPVPRTYEGAAAVPLRG